MTAFQPSDDRDEQIVKRKPTVFQPGGEGRFFTTGAEVGGNALGALSTRVNVKNPKPQFKDHASQEFRQDSLDWNI